MKDAAICVNRCLWSPDGNILGMETGCLTALFKYMTFFNKKIAFGHCFVLGSAYHLGMLLCSGVSYSLSLFLLVCKIDSLSFDLILRCGIFEAYRSDLYVCS